ncbi:MAG: nucleoside triphosphate pyrophosphohydrolase family protein [Candidatus Paceibacterota bacterium]
MKNSREDLVRKLHEAFSLPVGEEPSASLLELRIRLIHEEAQELFKEMNEAVALISSGKEVPKELYANMLKELADLQYVLSGTAVSLFPLSNLQEAFERVYESNMSKLDENGKPIMREDGKFLKSDRYFAPNLNDLIE